MLLNQRYVFGCRLRPFLSRRVWWAFLELYRLKETVIVVAGGGGGGAGGVCSSKWGIIAPY